MSRFSCSSRCSWSRLALNPAEVAPRRNPPAKPVADWSSDSVLQDVKALTVEGLGAMQGASFHAGKVYLYGDCYNVKPRVGVIREYSSDFKATGRVIWLRDKDRPLLRHPTGLTWHGRWGTFLGDTVAGKG